jgi:hypothetical protein
LLDVAALDVTALVESLVNLLDLLPVVFAVGGRIVVETDAKIPEIGFVLLIHPVDEFFRGRPFGPR